MSTWPGSPDGLHETRQFPEASVILNFPGFLEDNAATMETTAGTAFQQLQAVNEE